MFRPLDLVQSGEQPVRVISDPEEPLLELACFDLGAASLTAPADDLFVGKDGGVLGAPFDGGVLAVREALLEQPQKYPLRPPVVRGLVGGELARPVDGDSPFPELPRK